MGFARSAAGVFRERQRMVRGGTLRSRRVTSRLVAPSAVAVVAFVLCLAPASASAEGLCTDTWVGPAEGGWETVADWSAGHLPSSTDVACIGGAKTVVVSGGAQDAGVVQGEGKLEIAGGSLELSSALEPSVIADLTLGELRSAR